VENQDPAAIKYVVHKQNVQKDRFFTVSVVIDPSHRNETDLRKVGEQLRAYPKTPAAR